MTKSSSARSATSTTVLKGGTVVDATGSRRADVVVADGVVVGVGDDLSGDVVLDAGGCVVAPGLVDLHAHLRQPGKEEAETIESVTSRERALGRLVPRIVGLAVESRSVFSKLRFDPVMVRLMADDARYDDLLRRLDRLLSGDVPDAEARVRTAAAISAGCA